MTINFVNYNAPHYMINTADIVENKVSGIGQRGILVFDVDTSVWYITKDDLTLAVYSEAVGKIISTASDGNPTEFSCAVVGTHLNVATATLATKQTYAKPEGATGLLAQNTGTTGLRFTLDGTDPTSTLGFQLPAYQMPVIIPCPGTAIEMIRESAGAALDAQWVK